MFSNDFQSSLCTLSRHAGHIILSLRNSPKNFPQLKNDGSPVTVADQEAEALILAGLSRLAPDRRRKSQRPDDYSVRHLMADFFEYHYSHGIGRT